MHEFLWGKDEIERVREEEGTVLVEIAFEAAVPFGGRSGNGKSREEFRQWARRQRPIDLAESVDEILSGDVSPIHYSLSHALSLINEEKVCWKRKWGTNWMEEEKKMKESRKVPRVKKGEMEMKLAILFFDFSSLMGYHKRKKQR